jgi:hypothetical protein
MEGAHYRLFEITQHVHGDPLGNALMDEVLTACFDFTFGNGDALQRLVLSLNRFNRHLSGCDKPEISSGLFQGTPQQVSLWAEQLTDDILTNRAH